MAGTRPGQLRHQGMCVVVVVMVVVVVIIIVVVVVVLLFLLLLHVIIIIITTTTTATTTIIINWSGCCDPNLDVQNTKGELKTSIIIMIVIITPPPSSSSSSHCHCMVVMFRRWTRSTGARAETPSWTCRTRRAR